MSAYRAALVALFVVGALVTAAPAGAASLPAEASATGDSVAPDATDEYAGVVGPRVTAAQNETRNNSSLGADISSFMQSSTAEVGGAVETGMFTAAYNGTDNQSVRVRLVERQTDDLREELTELRERKAELVGERNATNVSDSAYRAKLGQLVGRINALRAALNATEERAREVDANVAEVTALQSDAENLTGPEIAAVARNATGVDLANGERGPPTEAGNGNGNGVAGADDRTTGPPNGSNESQRGPPSDANAPIVGNESGNATTIPNASTPTPPVTVDNSTILSDVRSDATVLSSGDAATTVLFGGNSASDAATVLSTASDATSDLSDPISDALAVRTYALSRSLTLA